MSVGFLDLVRVTLSTLGTGSTLTISAAVAGWLDFTTAGGINGTIYRYAIIDGNNTEIGTAVYNSGTNTLSGRTVTKSSNSNNPISLTSQAILAVSVAAEDLNVGGTNYGTMAGQAASAVAITGGNIAGLTSLGVAVASTLWPFQVHVATNTNLGVRNSSSTLELFSAVDSGAAYAPVAINGSFLSLQAGSGGQVGIGASTVGAPLAMGFGATRITSTPSTPNIIGLYDDGTGSSIYGFGISSGQMNVAVGGGGNVAFWSGTLNTMNIAGATGRVGIGTASPLGALDVVSTGNSPFRGVLSEQISSNAAGGQFLMIKYRGAPGSPTVVANTDTLGQFIAGGYDGSGVVATGGVAFKVNGTVAAGSIPTDMLFYSGATALVERMRIWSSGGVSINSASDPGVGNFTVGGTLTINTNVAMQPWMNVNSGAFGGTSGAAALALGQIGVSEGVTMTFTGATLDAMAFTHNIVGGAGLRSSWQMTTNVFTAAGSGGWNAATNGGFVTTLVLNTVAGPNPAAGVNAGGTALVPAGQIFCFNPELIFPTGATFYAEGCGGEINVSVQTGASAAYVSGLKIIHNNSHAVAGSVQDAAFVFTDTIGITRGWDSLIYVGTFGGAGAAQSPVATTGTILLSDATVTAFRGVDLSLSTFTGLNNAAFKSFGFSVDGSANMTCQGATQVFGQASNALTNFKMVGATGATAGGVVISIFNGPTNVSTNIVGQLGNYSAVFGGAYDGGLMTMTSVNGKGLWLGADAANWVYIQPANTTTAGFSSHYVSGMAVGWNATNGGGETMLVNRIDGGSQPWDFIFADWDGTTRTQNLKLGSGGQMLNNAGSYLPGTNTAPFNATTFVGGTQGAVGGVIGNGSASPTADTWCSIAFTSNNSDVHQVPYNSAGVAQGAALNCAVFMGYSGATSGSPLVGAATQVANIVMGKANALTSGGTGVYGQCGCLWLNAWGGWNGTSFTFDKTAITLSTGVLTYTVGAAPASHAYYIGMPVTTPTGPGVLPANTVIVAFTSTTVTLSAGPTTPGSATLRFSAGIVGVSPADTYLWVGESHCHDVNAVGCGSEIFEAVSGVSIGSNPFATAFGCRVLCGIANAQNVGTNPATHIVGVDVHSEYLNGATSGGIAYNAAASSVSGATVTWGLFGATSVGGSITMSFSSSDPKVKKDVARIASVKSLVRKIDPVTYRWTDDYPGAHPGQEGNFNFGFLSYDGHDVSGVREALDEFGFAGSSVCTPMGTKFHGEIVGIEARQMTAILWRGVQELWAEAEDLLDRMNGLEARITTIEQSMAVH